MENETERVFEQCRVLKVRKQAETNDNEVIREKDKSSRAVVAELADAHG